MIPGVWFGLAALLAIAAVAIACTAVVRRSIRRGDHGIILAPGDDDDDHFHHHGGHH